ncbi:trypsin-like peptidase domain-containing protein [Tautonia sociabilis]|uniref:PDZ domain-containing protein n=1 Tax=Tautonia sociabilis TaxID=2080755 RepID=A0A432MNP4_9BACT|nr:trypsin-like peptidase domain-containing protein [Tautonia sociabilis]RUL88940.1 PDZ domain-containing protein [Tautonia sociabilis]
MRRARAGLPHLDRRLPTRGAVLIGVVLVMGPCPLASAQELPTPGSLSIAFREAARRAIPAVVTVRPVGGSTVPRTDPGGSGVVIDATRGLILTNDHVVGDAERSGNPIRVVLPDGRSRPVLDVRRDPKSDLALLAINPEGLGLIPLEWGESDALEVGDWVLAVGQPFGLAGSVSAGIVGGTGRTLSLDRHRDLIQTDAAINPGSSGGALIDLSGRLVGINVAVQTIGGGHEGVGFAVPAARARRVSEDLATFGRVRRSAIGVRVSAVDPELAATLDPPGAVRVESVAPGGPAGSAGLSAGDLIVSIAGRAVSAPDQLVSAVEFFPVGEPMTVSIVRNGQLDLLEVRPEPLLADGDLAIGPISSNRSPTGEAAGPPEAPRARVRLPEPSASRDPTRFPELGLRVEEGSDELAARFGLSRDVSGLVIVGISPGGPADLGGLVPGMVITDLLDRRVATLTDLREAVATAPPERDLILRVLHRGRAEFRVILREGSRNGDIDRDSGRVMPKVSSPSTTLLARAG